MTKERKYELDFLKFVAAIFIVFHHFQQHFEVVFERFNFYGSSFNFGLMVELFFMISGYAVALNAEKYSRQSFKQFIKKKR